MRKAFALIPVLAAASPAIAVSGFDGNWAISFGQLAMYGVSGEAAFSDGKGSLRFFGGGAASNNNPCLNKRLPAVIKSVTDSEVEIDVDGGKILTGCLTETLILRPGANDSWIGTLS